MKKTMKSTETKSGNHHDVLTTMGIGFAWSGLLVLLMILFYILQMILGIGYEYVLETGVDGEHMWRVIPPSLDFALVTSVLLVMALLYWRLKRKKQICARAFSLQPLRPYAVAIALASLCCVGRGLLYAACGALNLSLENGIGGVWPKVAAAVGLALFGMLLRDGRQIGYLRSKGRNDERIVSVIAQETLVTGILAATLSVVNAYLKGKSVGVVGLEDVLSLLSGVAMVVLCSRLYLASDSMMGGGILQTISTFFTVEATAYSIWLFVADTVLLMGLYAAIRMLKEKADRCENDLT